ncbi:hypothetical protein I302_106053 [Kwoniella bestiolae CBS 10118]|uniref:Uncharacterized protein n=1 Tax=Kwoniella bestiolae CBS 10118 TaxID=1296100 RepID=A0A1B9G2W0_9TREE|nr:hypothetical protein I302_05178 [Kwoniella bestiolae CBS 10118]OCF25359.1 hypothetical protein I302_05178 [Kwoniella bestiolae CBS 10118]
MPITSTRGARNKFYNNLAKEARRLDTLALSTALTPGPSRGGSQFPLTHTTSASRSNSKGEGREPREMRYSNDEDDGGWGRVPTSNRGERPIAVKTNNVFKFPEDTYGDDGWGDRASFRQPHIQSSFTTSNIPPRPHLQDQEGRTTPPARTKVQQWISSSSPSSESKTIRTPSKAQTSTQGDRVSSFQHQSRGTRNTSRSGGENEDSMNYLSTEDIPSTSFRRYGTNPTTETNYQRTYTASGTGDMRSPQGGSGLHHTNPFLGGNLSYRGNDTEETPRMSSAALNTILSDMERTFQAKKREYEEAQRQMDEMRREKERPSFPLPARPPTSFGVNRTNEHDQIIQLRQENILLHQEVSSLHSTLSQAKETINLLNNRLDESRVNPDQLDNMQAEIDKLTKEHSSMNALCLSLDRKLEEEKDKNRKLELDNQSSKAGQSASAKSLQAAESRSKVLEGQLREMEDRERTVVQTKEMWEKRAGAWEMENSTLKSDIASANAKATMAFREKENAIAKYKGKENDNAKLSDKLNLSRREQDALQARLEELIEEKTQLSQQRASEKGDLADRRKLKDELIRERSTSDRLRSERNTLRAQIQKFKIQLSSNPAHTDETSKRKDNGNVELHHPRPTSEEKYKPRFSLSQSDDSIFEPSLGRGDREKKDGGVAEVEVEVIEDDDGVEYQPQKISVEGDKPKDKDTDESTVKIDEVSSKNRKTNDYSHELESILSPRLTFSSIPLVPNKLNTPISKEEVLLFSPTSDYHDTAQTKDSAQNAKDEKVRGVSVSEEERKKWLDRYAGLYTDKDGKDTSTVINENNPSSSPNMEKPKDPFADLDPLDGKLFSPKSTPRSPITAKAKAKTLGESLMDLLGSPSGSL